MKMLNVVSYAALALMLATSVFARDSRIINGVIVPYGYFPEVMQIKVESSMCSATLVGPSVAITAGHCAPNGAKAKVTVDGKEYVGTATRHPDYPKNDVDIAVVIFEKAISKVVPASIGGVAAVGKSIYLLGFGCTNEGGGGLDGMLRMGESVITSLNEHDFISKKEEGGVLCFGDSGGPAFVKEKDRYLVVGVSSKGNIKDTNYSLNVSHPEVLGFLKDVADKEDVEICGLNADCLGGPEPLEPQFGHSTFDLDWKEGDSNSVFLPALLETPMKGVTWNLDSKAPAWLTIKNDALLGEVPKGSAGVYEATLTAKNSAGADALLIKITVTPLVEKPACTLVADPAFVTLGQTIKLSLLATGNVTSAKIGDKDVPIPKGTLVFTPPTVGVFTTRAEVMGPGGTAMCATRFAVK